MPNPVHARAFALCNRLALQTNLDSLLMHLLTMTSMWITLDKQLCLMTRAFHNEADLSLQR